MELFHSLKRATAPIGGILSGRADGHSPTILMLKDRDLGDFELRFEALVHKGAVRVKMRGPGPGPLGIAVEITSDKIEVVANGSSFFIAASNRPDEWDEYRVLFRAAASRLAVSRKSIVCPVESMARYRYLSLPFTFT
jgi:hypothetical protein